MSDGDTMKRIKVLGVGIDLVTMQETLQWIEKVIAERKPCQIITGNPEMLMLAQKDEGFYQVMNQADLVVPDGIGLVIAARRFLKAEVPERVAGFDIATLFMPIAQKKGYRLYLLGAVPGVAETARDRLTEQYPGLRIVGVHDGFLHDGNRREVVEEIRGLKTDLLLVGMGAPRQEKFIADHKEELQVPVSIGLGGSIDVWAGVAKRAPKVWQDLHLEWLYRLLRQPSRIGRMMALPRFILNTVRYKERRVQ